MAFATAPDAGWLLTLWEQGLQAPRRQRDDALLACAHAAPPPQALGQRQVALLAAHAQWFGPALALRSACPACQAELAWEVDSAALAQTLAQMPAGSAEPALTHAGGRLHLRAPLVDDVDRAVAAGPQAYADALLAACVAGWQPGPDAATNTATDTAPDPSLDTSPDTARHTVPAPLPAPADWPADLRAAALARLEALDPAASVSFALACPACGQAWDAPLDPGAALWRKVQAAAERLLQEIDLLARAYGWREADVLALSPLRRAAYLQLVQA